MFNTDVSKSTCNSGIPPRSRDCRRGSDERLLSAESGSFSHPRKLRHSSCRMPAAARDKGLVNDSSVPGNSGDWPVHSAQQNERASPRCICAPMRQHTCDPVQVGTVRVLQIQVRHLAPRPRQHPWCGRKAHIQRDRLPTHSTQCLRKGTVGYAPRTCLSARKQARESCACGSAADCVKKKGTSAPEHRRKGLQQALRKAKVVPLTAPVPVQTLC